MKRALAPLVVIFVLSGVPQVHAAPPPTIDAAAFGIELCPQSVCGAAIFVGVLSGRVGTTPAVGTFAVAVTHAPLPGPGDSAPITGGLFEIRIGTRTLRGAVVGGTLENLGNNTFKVRLALATTGGAVLGFEGILNHNVFPPTIIGRIATIGG